MAQNIILKRSALPGKVPDTGSLNLGEIALNTYDGRAFIHKSGSTESIEHIVVTNSTTTGSITITQTGSFGEINVTNDINVSGSIYVTNDIVANGDLDVLGAVSASVVSASMYYGDGSQLTGISAGATDTEIPSNDWDYNLPDSGSLSDGNNQSTKYTIDFQAEGYGVRPVGYQTFISNNNGSSEIIPGTDGIVFIVNNLEVGRIDAGGIIGNTPLGTISSSAQIASLGYVTSSAAASIPNGTISSSAQITAFGFVSGSYLTSLSGAISSSSQLTQYFEQVGSGIISGAAQLPSGLISGAAQLPSGLISGSSQLTSSYDNRYVLSGSVSAVPDGTISGSAQITSFGFVSGSYETTGRSIVSSSAQITPLLPGGIISSSAQIGGGIVSSSVQVLGNSGVWSGSAQLPAGIVSGSSQLTNLNTLTSSVLTQLQTLGTYTGSVETRFTTLATLTGSNGVRLTNLETTSASVNTSITNINTFSSSVLTRLTTIGTYTSSLNTWTSSVATTGSNSFNGNQNITGSLTVSSVAVVSASVTLPSGSILSLTSGSSLLVQNSGLVEITGSLVVSGSTTINNYRIDDAWATYSIAWTADGTNPTLNNGTLTGYYKLIGKTCFVRVKLVIGSTTSVGSGAWQFSLPFTAASADGVQFPCSMLDNTVAWYAGVVNGTYSGLTTKSAILCTTSGTHAFSAVTPNNPFVWGTGDSLMFNGSYEIA